MAGPSWLAGTFAAVMILTAAYSAGRLALSRPRRRATELDVDALHAVMGAAMAGMLAPPLNPLPDGAWAAVFSIAAAWFGWHAVRGRGPGISGNSRCRFPLPHLIECVAMLYMLVLVHGPRPMHGGAGMTMAGMAGSAGFPALAAVLALFMLGYIVWTTDRLTTLARAKTTTADLRENPGHQSPAAVTAAAAPHNAGSARTTPADVRTRHEHQADQPVLAPKLAACGKLAMGITMGYMLILML
jgi:Domain of unknown function (DUF5134)